MEYTAVPNKFNDEDIRENKAKPQKDQVGGILYILMMSLTLRLRKLPAL